MDLLFVLIVPNVLRLPEGGEFGAFHFQLNRNFDRSTKLDLTTEPPLVVGAVIASVFFAVHFLHYLFGLKSPL